ncbi:MAG: phage holin family protein [Acidobacteriota bacterium]
MRILVYGLAIAAVVTVVPGIEVDEGNPFVDIVFVGIIYGLLSAYIKPVLALVLMRFVVETYGLVIVLINVAIFLLLAYLSGFITVEGVGSALVGAVLLGLLVFFLEGLLGLTPPVADRGSSEVRD